jgi:putative oxidoreductase
MISDEFVATWSPRLLSVLRIVVGALFLEHGLSKFFGFPMTMPPAFQLTSLAGASGAFELVGGALMLVGLFTRPTAFILSGNMAFAYFIAHFPHGFFPIINGGDAAVLYSFVFLYFAVAGGGPWAVDAVRGVAGRGALGHA